MNSPAKTPARKRRGEASPATAAFVFDPLATPKAQLVGRAVAVERAARRLRPLLGAPTVFADGLGWNLNKREFQAAEHHLQGGAPIRPARARRRLLVAIGAAAPPTLQVGDLTLRFSGWGRPFRMGDSQAAVNPPRDADAPLEVRYAYYR